MCGIFALLNNVGLIDTGTSVTILKRAAEEVQRYRHTQI